MNVKVIALPELLSEDESRRSAIVVFDVLRATTSMLRALEVGASEIRVFDTTEAARAAWERFDGAKLLAGERDCLPPPGFDVGNSPREFSAARCGGRTIFMSTTNGTRAMLAASAGAEVLAAALVNASATARHLLGQPRDVLLLCAGTRGEVAMEDLLGAGGVLSAMLVNASGAGRVALANDMALVALQLFELWRRDLVQTIAETAGGRHVIAAGLAADLEEAARVDAVPLVAEVCDGRVVRPRVAL